MSADFSPHLQAAILEDVMNQIANNNPPETHQAYKWLLREGRRERDAKVLKASVVAVEIFEVINRREPFNYLRFVRAMGADFLNFLKHRSRFFCMDRPVRSVRREVRIVSWIHFVTSSS